MLLIFIEMPWKFDLKYASLVILVAQNAALVLTMRYSRIASTEKMYLASTAVVLTELMKLAISLSIVFYNDGLNVEKTAKQLYTEIVVKFSEVVKVSVPSVLYTVQNNLLYVALSHLNAVTFQVRHRIVLESILVWQIICKTALVAGNVPAENPHHSSVLCAPSQKDLDEIEVVLSRDFNDCCGHGSGEECMILVVHYQ